jgi:hypothetical protein
MARARIRECVERHATLLTMADLFPAPGVAALLFALTAALVTLVEGVGLLLPRTPHGNRARERHEPLFVACNPLAP